LWSVVNDQSIDCGQSTDKPAIYAELETEYRDIDNEDLYTDISSRSVDWQWNFTV